MEEAVIKFVGQQPQVDVERFINAYILKIEGNPEKKTLLLQALAEHFCRPQWYTSHGHISWRGQVMLKLLKYCVNNNDSVTIPAPKAWLPASKDLNLALLPFQAYADGVLGSVDTTWVHHVLLHLASEKHASVDMWPATLGALARFLAANDAAALKQTKDATAQAAAVHVAHLLTRAALMADHTTARSSSSSSSNGHGGDAGQSCVWDGARAFTPQDPDVVDLEDLGAVLAVLWLKPLSNAARVFLIHMCDTLLGEDKDKGAPSSASSSTATGTTPSSSAVAADDMASRFGFAVILKQFTRPQLRTFALQVLAQFTRGRDRMRIVQGMMPWLRWPLQVDTSIKLPQQSRTKGIAVAVWVTELLTQMGKLRDTSPDELRWLAGSCGSRILNACMSRDNAAGNIQVFRVLFLGVDGIATEVEDLLPKLHAVIAANKDNRPFLLTANVVCSALAVRYSHLSNRLEKACAPARALNISPMQVDLCKRFIHFNTFSFKDALPATATPLLQPAAPSTTTASASTSAIKTTSTPRSLASITPAPITPQPRSLSQPAGLRNLGNTCYLNSVVQALYSLTRFRCEVISLLPSLLSSKSPVLYHAAQLFQQLATHPKNIIIPSTFVQRVRPPWFTPGQQQDSAEFLQYFLDVMHTEYEALAPARSAPSTVASPINKRAKIGPNPHTNGDKRVVESIGSSSSSHEVPASSGANATTAKYNGTGAVIDSHRINNGGVADGATNGIVTQGRGEPMDLSSDTSDDDTQEVASSTGGSGDATAGVGHGRRGYEHANPVNGDGSIASLSQLHANGVTPSSSSSNNNAGSSESNNCNSITTINSVSTKGRMAGSRCSSSLPAPLALLTGKTRKTTTCSVCATPSARTEEFFLLQLPLPEQQARQQKQQQRATMTDLLQHYLEDETLEGDNKYMCDACDKAQVATVTTELSALPPHLLLTINRFRYDKTAKTRRKVTTPVSLTRRLRVPQTTASGNVVESVYRLQAVVVHTGASAYSGHYYSFACINNDWYNLNDSFVRQIDESTLESKLGGTNCAYIVMYARDDDKSGAEPAPPSPPAITCTRDAGGGGLSTRSAAGSTAKNGQAPTTTGNGAGSGGRGGEADTSSSGSQEHH